MVTVGLPQEAGSVEKSDAWLVLGETGASVGAVFVLMVGRDWPLLSFVVSAAR